MVMMKTRTLWRGMFSCCAVFVVEAGWGIQIVDEEDAEEVDEEGCCGELRVSCLFAIFRS